MKPAPGKIVNANNVSYFISDGVPTYGSGTTTALVKDCQPIKMNGDGSSSTNNSDVGIQADEQSIWENFLNSNKITSYAVAIGSDAATVKSYLDQLLIMVHPVKRLSVFLFPRLVIYPHICKLL